MSQRYRHKKTSVTLINYHFVWIPVRRRKVLVGPVADRLEALLREAAERIEGDIQYIAIQPDHVHLFVSAPPTLAPDQIMFRLKGYTSRYLRQEFPALRKMPSLWTRSYFCATAGMVSSATIQRYIEEQSRR
jgi:putative transposase